MNNFKFDLKTLWILLNLVWIVPFIGYLIVIVGDKNFDKLGPFGDFVAGTTVPTLTFISFLAVVITLRMQKDQLEMQREELKNSIEEMKETRKEFIEQNKTLSSQRFESTFFQMVNLHNEIVKSLSYQSPSGIVTGRAAFPFFYDDLIYFYKRVLMQEEIEGKDELTKTRMAYQKFFGTQENQLGHYFRNLYRIVKFINESEIENKKTYVGIIKAQLSSNELALLLYNGLSIEGYKFLPIMYKYSLLDNLNGDLLILKSTHLELFKELAEEALKEYKSIQQQQKSH